MGLLLIPLVFGILVSPCLDIRYVGAAIPVTILTLTLPSKRGRRWSLYLLVGLVGALNASLHPTIQPIQTDTAVRVVGTLRKAPEWRGLGTYLDVELHSIDAQPYRGRARLTEFLNDPGQREVFDALDLGSGDRLEIVVKVHRPAVYRDPGVFDYRRHLERQGIYWTGTIRNPRLITILDRGWHGPDRIKKWIDGRVEAPFPSSNDGSGSRNIKGLVAGMVLGRTYGLTAGVERQFQAAGLYHLVVVSGFNLAVVAGAAFWIVRWLPCKRRTRLLIVLACALAYAAIAEGQTPVFRATLMVAFLIVSRLMDRGYSLANAIAGSAFIILLMDPTAIEDPSFQMTFAAVLAVVGIGVPATQWAFGSLSEELNDLKDLWGEWYGLPPWLVTLPRKILLVIGESLVISLCVETVFLVFMVESFHRISPISPFINVPAGLAAALITPLALMLIFLPPPLSTFLGWVIAAVLSALLKMVDLALRIPGATFRVPSPPTWIWLLYAILVASLVWSIRKRAGVICAGSAIGILGLQIVILAKDFPPPPPKSVTLTFLDVGQGDSSLIELPSGYRMLIDGGGVASGRFLDLRDESTFSIGESVISPYLFGRGIRKLDAVVLTHAHHDHMDGLFSVIQNFRIGEFWLGRNPMTSQYRELLEMIQEKQIPIRWVTAGQTVGDFTVLHPPANWIPRKNDQNNDSVVLFLNSGGRTALLTGDIERSIPVPERVDVLKVPHHGSKGVRVRPEAGVRVISVGANNPFGHPHPSALPGLRTDELGAVTVTLPGSRFQLSTAALTDPRCSCNLTLLLKSHYSRRP